MRAGARARQAGRALRTFAVAPGRGASDAPPQRGMGPRRRAPDRLAVWGGRRAEALCGGETCRWRHFVAENGRFGHFCAVLITRSKLII